jgi:hypothetical protein
LKEKNLMLELSKAPFVDLKNGVRVVNFSSGHSFLFDDGTVLPACDEDRVRGLEVHTREHLTAPEDTNVIYPEDAPWRDVTLEIHMSPAVEDELTRLRNANLVDIIIVPRLVLEAAKRSRTHIEKLRTIRVARRGTKDEQPVCCSDRFCL